MDQDFCGSLLNLCAQHLCGQIESLLFNDLAIEDLIVAVIKVEVKALSTVFSACILECIKNGIITKFKIIKGGIANDPLLGGLVKQSLDFMRRLFNELAFVSSTCRSLFDKVSNGAQIAEIADGNC